MDNLNPTPEEMQEMIRKAQADWEAALEKMTPEERRQAELNAQRAVEQDKANMQRMIDEVQQVAAQIPTPQSAAPEFCSNCGAPAGGGNFCTYCGSPLR